jgi:hypothetical protein
LRQWKIFRDLMDCSARYECGRSRQRTCRVSQPGDARQIMDHPATLPSPAYRCCSFVQTSAGAMP